MCIRSAFAVNLERLHNFLSSGRFWTYSIAFDSATNDGDAHMDLRLCLVFQGSVHQFHILFVSTRASHTGEAIFKMVIVILRVLVDDSWIVKLLSAATNGARNMVQRYQGAVARLEQVTTASSFLIWCTAHQLHLVVQAVTQDVMHTNFYQPLIFRICYLSRQASLIKKMGSKCPYTGSTR